MQIRGCAAPRVADISGAQAIYLRFQVIGDRRLGRRPSYL